MSNEKVMNMQCTHGYTVYEKRMYVCLYWLWSTDYVQMCEILWNKYSFIHSTKRQQAITWSNADFSVVRFSGIYLSVIHSDYTSYYSV